MREAWRATTFEVYARVARSAREAHSAHDVGVITGSTTITGTPQGAAILGPRLWPVRSNLRVLAVRRNPLSSPTLTIFSIA